MLLLPSGVMSGSTHCSMYTHLLALHAAMDGQHALCCFAGLLLLLLHVCRCDHRSGLCHAVTSPGCDERITSPAGYIGRQPSAGGAVLNR